MVSVDAKLYTIDNRIFLIRSKTAFAFQVLTARQTYIFRVRYKKAADDFHVYIALKCISSEKSRAQDA